MHIALRGTMIFNNSTIRQQLVFLILKVPYKVFFSHHKPSTNLDTIGGEKFAGLSSSWPNISNQLFPPLDCQCSSLAFEPWPLGQYKN